MKTDILSFTRFESLLLCEHQLSADQSQNEQDTTKNKNKYCDDRLLQIHASKVASRASTIGMLESSLHEELSKDSMERLAIAGFLDKKKFNDDVAFSIDKVADISETEFSSNSSITNCKQMKTNNSLTKSFNLTLVEPNLDDFFQQFPGCINDDVEFEDDFDVEMQIDETFKKDTRAMNESYSNSRQQNPYLKQQRQEGKKIQHSKYTTSEPIFDYNSDKMNNSIAENQISLTNMSWDNYNQPNQSSYPPQQASNGNISQHQNYHKRTSIHNDQSQKRQQPQRNDFLTASELVCNQNDVDDNETVVDEYNHTFHSRQQSNNQIFNRHEKYLHTSQHHSNLHSTQIVSAQIRGPNLSAGLKRKYKPPKIQGNKTRKNCTSENVNRSAPPLYAQKKNISNDNDSYINKNKKDDDELPEELQHLDKELVTKIEHEILDNSESVTFGDIAGLENAKQTVLELVCWPMKRPDLFTGLRKGPNGLLLFGPPGTGKTLIGKAVAHESGATFFSISSSSLTSKWIGEGEKLVKTLFAVAMYRQPAVVFIDEIDSLLTQRKSDENEASRRIKTEFLVQLDGAGGSTNTGSNSGTVLVIGATNRPHELDDAARRRFVKRIYIPLPERQDREILLRTLLSKNRHSMADKDITKLSMDTDGFSGADLKALCTDAALGPIRKLGSLALKIKAEDVPPISYRHFRSALKGMNPSVAQSDLDVYLTWNATYGSKIATENSDDDDNENSFDE